MFRERVTRSAFVRVAAVVTVALGTLPVVGAEDGARAGSVSQLSVLAIEATQATQCLDTGNGYTKCPDNSLELTTGRPVVVRVYVGHDGPQCPANSPFNTVVQKAKVTLRWVATHTGDPGGHVPDEKEADFDVPCSANLAELRNDARGSATFILPADRLGNPNKENLLWIEAEVSSDQVQTGGSKEIQLGGTDGSGKPLVGGLFPRDSATVAWIPTYYWPDKSKDFPNDPYSGSPLPDGYPTYETIFGAAAMMQNMFPMPVDYERYPGVFPWVSKVPNPDAYKFICSTGSCPDLRDAGAKDDFLSHLDKFMLLMKPRPDSLVAWLPSAAVQCTGRGGNSGTAYTTVCTPGVTESMLAHEVGHTMNIWHPDKPPPQGEECWPFYLDGQIKESGYSLWKKTPAPVASSTSDFMTSGASGSEWISPYFWNRLLKKPYSDQWAKVGSGCASSSASSSSAASGRPNTGSAGWLPGAASPAVSEPVMLVSGRILPDDTGELDPVYGFQGEGPFPSSDPAGTYCLDLETSTGFVLDTHCFDLPVAAEIDGGSTRPGFALLLPHPASMGRLVLRDGDSVLATRTASAQAPALAVLQPAGGGIVTGSVTVSWAASDADGDDLEYSLLYSHNGGASWFPLVVGTPVASGEIDTDLLPGGTNAVFRVIATDGLRSAVADSPTFAVPDKAPRAGITAPQSGDLVDFEDDLVLSGYGSDFEDGQLTEGDLAWSSDRDGFLGTGSQVVVARSTLSLGVHRVTLTATDSSGQQATAEILLHVGRSPSLQVPGEVTVQYSDALNFLVSATDPDHAASSLRFTASGLPPHLTLNDNLDGTATISGFVGIAAGSLGVEITVTDPNGFTDLETITVLVSPEDADVTFAAGNPVAVQVVNPEGDSGEFTVTAGVAEHQPDEPSGMAGPGDISLADVSIALVPVGPGASAVPVACAKSVAGSGYDAVQEVACTFDGVPVNTYIVAVTVDGGYYAGSAEDVLAVYDPSLGFTTGGGWFYWPGTDDRTNFGYTMMYNRKGTKVQGSFLLIRHLADGSKYRVKSNALYGLALGENIGMGWASFSGKATYLEPGWLEPLGNHEFVVYVEDHGESGAGGDRVWMETHNRDGEVITELSMPRGASDNAETLSGGNIVVPH